MSSQRLLVVLGATGNQGGSVIKTFLEHPQYKIRGLTRNTSSDKAKALTEQGVEMVSANIEDRSAIDKVFKGADIVFAVTDFWAHLNSGSASDSRG